MSNFVSVSPKELTESPFALLSEDWALLTAGDSAGSGVPAMNCNPMTVSWGGVGVLWNKPVATIYVRPQRHTFGILEQAEHFTLSFFEKGTHRAALSFCGSKSGREHDKFQECGLTPLELDGGVAVAEARLVLACRKLYWNDIDPAHFLDAAIDTANYPGKDYHRMYIGEISGIYRAAEQ